MDYTPITEALEKARLIISAHGLVKHMPDYSKKDLGQPVNTNHSALRYEFLLDPTISSYSSENYSATFSVNYDGKQTERDGGIYYDLQLNTSVRLSAMELRSKNIVARENMISSLMMLCDMVELSLPKEITITVWTPEQLRDKRAREKEQIVARDIHHSIGKECIKNLRAGGKPKLTQIPHKYVERYGEMPPEGTYRYSTSKYSRRGGEKDRKDYVFSVVKYDTETWYVRARRTA